MNSIMEGINNRESDISDIFLLKNIETSGRSLLETLEKNIGILRYEARQIANINLQLETKLGCFNELSDTLKCKLESLVALADFGFGDKDGIKSFVEQITLSWVHVNKEVVKEYAGIRVASRTTSGTPLMNIANKIKKDSSAVKVSLQIGSVIYDQDYVSRGFEIYDEILRILDTLDKCDDKVQQYLVICKTTPYLVDLSGTIDNFVANTNLLPTFGESNFAIDDDLMGFRFVCKLLTGELLGEEPSNPVEILAENAPRKPVFITLNNKRKMEIPKISANKIFRSSSFPPTLKFK